MRILVAPDKFKHALTATQAAAAIAAGIRGSAPDAEIDLCPMADGGEGTGVLLAKSGGFRQETAEVQGPLGRACSARWWRTLDGLTAIVELAEASGLALLSSEERDPLQTSTYGTGQLIAAAIAAGAHRILLCVGGSATVDGGAGCLQALGWKALDEQGTEIAAPLGGGGLASVAEVRPPTKIPRCTLEILCDVENSLTGSEGAARVFAPQKGAAPEQVCILEAGLVRWADCLRRMSGDDITTLRGGGAAGGVPAGLCAALGARVVPGFATVARWLRLEDRLAAATHCVTGEGRVDSQTLFGKVVAGVARAASIAGVPCVALAGSVEGDAGHRAGLRSALMLSDLVVISPPRMSLEQALRETGPRLSRAAQELALRWAAQP